MPAEKHRVQLVMDRGRMLQPMSSEEGALLQIELSNGASIHSIARRLGCNASTLSREVRRQGAAQDAVCRVAPDGRLHGTGRAEGFTRQMKKLPPFLLGSPTYDRDTEMTCYPERMKRLIETAVSINDLIVKANADPFPPLNANRSCRRSCRCCRHVKVCASVAGISVLTQIRL